MVRKNEKEKEKRKKKGKEEWRRKEVGGSCYASGWHENRGTRSRTVVRKWKKKKKKKGRMEEKGSPRLLLCHTVARGTWHLVVELRKKEKKKGK